MITFLKAVCSSLRSFLGKPLIAWVQERQRLLHISVLAKFSVQCCGKLLVSKGADTGMASVAQEKGVTCCGESDVHRSES